MKSIGKGIFILVCILSFLTLTAFGPSPAAAAGLGKPNAAFDVNKMGDMSDFDPNNPVIPTGDTIKIALGGFLFRTGGLGGTDLLYISVLWAAHDINKRGGILVDGKKKLVEVIKADHMSKPDQCKKICERMVLQEKVHVLWGTDGSHLMKVINETANKYKVIAQNTAALSDDLNGCHEFLPLCFHDLLFHRPDRTWRRLLLRPNQEKGKKVLHPLPGLHVRSLPWPPGSRKD